MGKLLIDHTIGPNAQAGPNAQGSLLAQDLTRSYKGQSYNRFPVAQYDLSRTRVNR